jgi:hypothetical protein
MLKRLTGRNFEFNPWKPVGRQSEAVQRWRTYVEDYLATGAGPPNQRYR